MNERKYIAEIRQSRSEPGNLAATIVIAGDSMLERPARELGTLVMTPAELVSYLAATGIIPSFVSLGAAAPIRKASVELEEAGDVPEVVLADMTLLHLASSACQALVDLAFKLAPPGMDANNDPIINLGRGAIAELSHAMMESERFRLNLFSLVGKINGTEGEADGNQKNK